MNDEPVTPVQQKKARLPPKFKDNHYYVIQPNGLNTQGKPLGKILGLYNANNYSFEDSNITWDEDIVTVLGGPFTIEWYEDLLRGIKDHFPQVNVHGFSPPEPHRPIYAVYATYASVAAHLLGYCISNSDEDIKAYYDEQNGYGLDIQVVTPIVIPSGYATQKSELVRQREVLKKQIELIDRKIQAKT